MSSSIMTDRESDSPGPGVAWAGVRVNVGGVVCVDWLKLDGNARA
jgi:hypothetical protein